MVILLGKFDLSHVKTTNPAYFVVPGKEKCTEHSELKYHDLQYATMIQWAWPCTGSPSALCVGSGFRGHLVEFGRNIQGVPKVRSSVFMHYNFWSKLYFYMKFLKDVYFSIKYMYSEFQKLACPFVFLSHSVAVAAWNGIQRVDPQMIHFELFITW